MNPKISVITPVYKTNEQFLREAIESILNQTFNDFEFLLCDDCPDDDREEIIKSYKDARIKYFKNATNLGASSSRNRLIDMAQGEYLAIFDSDDISYPDRFARQVEFLDAHPEVGLLAGAFNKNSRDGKHVVKTPADDYAIKIELMNQNCITNSSVMIRRSVVEKANLRYETSCSPSEDYLFYVRLIPHTAFASLTGDAIGLYRFYSDNTSSRNKANQECQGEIIATTAKIMNPELAKIAEAICVKNIRIKLFDFLSIIKVKKNLNKTTVFLFGFFPIISWKKKIDIREKK